MSQECQPKFEDLQVKGYENVMIEIINSTIYASAAKNNIQFFEQLVIKILFLPSPDVCGDGIISGIEECDDGNNIKQDICNNCSYQCQEYCIKCIKGLYFEFKQGWQVDPNTNLWVCKEICGDRLIVGIEKFNPGTYWLSYPGKTECKECQLSCEYDCTK